jgi:uncharacterized protein
VHLNVTSIDAQTLLSTYASYLEQEEVQHSVILSACEKAAEVGGAINCWLVSDRAGPRLIAVQNPGATLALSSGAADDASTFATALPSHSLRFPGVTGPRDVASAFAARWSTLASQAIIESIDLVHYAVSRVVLPSCVTGRLRLAQREECHLLATWLSGFERDALRPSEPKSDEAAAREKASHLITSGRMFVWDVRGQPVAQAAISGTKRVPRITAVYTPPEYRGKGYGSALIAHLSQLQIEAGRKLCCLYADTSNPVANAIYQRIGYRPVGRSRLYVMEHFA